MLQMINAVMQDSTSLYLAGNDSDAGALASGVRGSRVLGSRVVSLASSSAEAPFLAVTVDNVKLELS